MTSRTLAEAWIHVLTLSNVTAADRCCILDSTVPRSPYQHGYAAICRQAARALGVEPVRIDLDLDSPERLAAALREASFVVDLVFLHDPIIHRVRAETGARVLVVKDSPDALLALLPQAEHKTATLAAAEQLRRGGELSVRSPLGTDFSAAFGDFRINLQYGFSDLPGKWDQWPGCFLAGYSNEGSARGTVVLPPGTPLLPYRHWTSAPVALEIREGFITRIDAGAGDGMLCRLLDEAGDPDDRAVSHLGWGVGPASRFFAPLDGGLPFSEAQDCRCAPGNFLFSTGPNVNGGGNRRASLHLDIPIRGAAVTVGGQPGITLAA